MELLFINIVTIITMITIYMYNNRNLSKTLFLLLVEEFKCDLQNKQMKIASSILKNARHIHYRKFSEYFTNNKSFYINNNDNCELLTNTVALYLQQHDMLLKEIFNKALITIVKNELEREYYLYIENKEFDDFIKRIKDALEDYICHEYNKQYLKYNYLPLSKDDKNIHIKEVCKENTILEVALFQIFSQCKILTIENNNNLKDIEHKNKYKPFELLRNIIQIRLSR
ncbi:MAG: hypothetical protein ACOC33_02095 [bacterium]